MQWKVVKYYTNKQSNFVGNFTSKLYDKRDDFNFCNANSPYLCYIKPSSPAFGDIVSQLICKDILYI